MWLYHIFFKNPLQSAKVIDFSVPPGWKECVDLMSNKRHLSQEGLNKIVAIKGVMNKKLKEKWKIALPDHIPLIAPTIQRA
jgi:hypothetical protein